MGRRWPLLIFAGAVLAFLPGCGADSGLVQGTRRFVNDEFKFEISVTEEMDRAGWFIIREEDSALAHEYTPPDSSAWEPVAVVVPPSSSFLFLAPFNVDIFRLRNPATTAEALGRLRAEQVGERLRSRRSRTIGGQPAEEVIYTQGASVIYETYLVRNGLGYSINALGALESAGGASGFVVNATAYDQVVLTFRFLQ